MKVIIVLLMLSSIQARNVRNQNVEELLENIKDEIESTRQLLHRQNDFNCALDCVKENEGCDGAETGCACKEGYQYEGEECVNKCDDGFFFDPEIEECVKENCNCGENAECVPGTATVECQCKPGYSKDNNGQCIEDPCMDTEFGICGRHGSCFFDPNPQNEYYKCECETGFSGKRCNIDPCEANPDICGENGKCYFEPESTTKYGCACEEGHFGPQCEKECDDGFFFDPEIEECVQENCNCGENAECVPGTATVECQCKPGYSKDNNGQCVVCGCSGEFEECKHRECQCIVGYERNGIFECVKTECPIDKKMVNGDCEKNPAYRILKSLNITRMKMEDKIVSMRKRMEEKIESLSDRLHGPKPENLALIWRHLRNTVTDYQNVGNTIEKEYPDVDLDTFWQRVNQLKNVMEERSEEVESISRPA